MKIWNGFGSEHSMNLVMVGRFKEARDADKAKKVIDQIMQQVQNEPEIDPGDTSVRRRRFSDEMMELFRAAELYSIGPAELEQFAYDTTVQAEGNEVVVRTDEVDVSAFLKILLDKGARVEVYSAHFYPDAKEKLDG